MLVVRWVSRGGSPRNFCWASSAQGLEVAEQVAGKTASITSAQIMAEAVEIAKLRGESTELRALSHLVSDKTVSKQLVGMAKAAQAREEDERAATASGDTSKEIVGTLRVINHTHECLRIMVDGRFIGTVHEGRTRNFHVHAHFLTWHIDN